MLYCKAALCIVVFLFGFFAIFGFSVPTTAILAPTFAIIAATSLAVTLLPVDVDEKSDLYKTLVAILDFFLQLSTVAAALVSGVTWMESAGGLRSTVHGYITVLATTVVLLVFAIRITVVIATTWRSRAPE